MKNMIRLILIVILSAALMAAVGCGMLSAAEPIPTLASTIDLPPLPTAAPTEPAAVAEDTQALEETAAPEETPQPDGSAPTETEEPTLPAADLPPYPGPGDGEEEPEGGSSAGDLSDLESTPITLPGPVNRVAWPAPDMINLEGAEVALLQSDGEFLPVLLDPPTLAEPISIPSGGGQVIALAPDASSLVIQTGNQAAVFTPANQQLQALPAQAIAASYSDDSRYLAVSSADQIQATIYDLAENTSTQIDGFTTAAPVYSTYIAPGGQTAAWVSRATLQFHDVSTNTLGQRLDAPDFINTIAFSPDGQRLALSAGNSLELYSVPSGEQLAQVTLSEPASSLDFSPDGQILLSDYGSGIQSWDAETLAPVSAVSSDSSTVTLVSFSPGGDTIITLHDDNTLRVWKARE